MDHPHGGFDAGAAGVSTTALVLRLALLLVTTLVAGAGLVRPQLTTESSSPGTKWLRTANFALAALAIGLVVVSLVTQDVHVLGALVHGVLVALVPVVFHRPAVRWVAAALTVLLVIETSVGASGVLLVANTVYVAGAVAWIGLALLTFLPSDAPRARQHALALGVVLAIAGGVRLVSSGLAFDRRMYETLLGVVLLAVVLLPLAALGIRKYGTVAVAVGLLAWSGVAAIPTPQELPRPGVPVLTSKVLAGKQVPVLISPHRPGRNLVHFPAGAGNLQVGVGDGPTTPAVPSAGADGTWAEVDLPTGRGEITIASAQDSVQVEFDTGTTPGPVADVECASSALGGLITGRRDVLTACPADELSTEDADALAKLVTFLKNKGVRSARLVQDSTPRGVQAAELVRDSGLEGSDSGDALVVLSGWKDAHEALTRAGAEQAERPVYPHGLYVAPWLLTTPIATSVTTLAVPLRFDPREPLPIGYAIEIGADFGGENPTPAGFRTWRGGRSAGDQVQIYAVAQVTAMPMGPNEAHGPGMPMQEELAGQWVPKATVVPVSPVLT